MTDTGKPWLVDDALWALVEPLLPVRPRRAQPRQPQAAAQPDVATSLARKPPDGWQAHRASQ
jgi:transposase